MMCGFTTGAHRAARELGEALRPPMAHDHDADMTQGVLVEEFPNEELQDLDHHGTPVGAHVCHGGSPAQIQQNLQGKGRPSAGAVLSGQLLVMH